MKAVSGKANMENVFQATLQNTNTLMLEMQPVGQCVFPPLSSLKLMGMFWHIKRNNKLLNPLCESHSGC